MTRDDCMWVAYRSTGLLLIACAILFLPQLVTVVSVHFTSSGEFSSISTQVNGMGKLTQTMASASRLLLVQGVLQVVLPLLGGIFFLNITRPANKPENERHESTTPNQ